MSRERRSNFQLGCKLLVVHSSTQIIYKKECEDLREELEVKTKTLQDLEEEKTREIEHLRRRIDQLETEKERLNNEHSTFEKERLDREVEKAKLQTEIESLQKQLHEKLDKFEQIVDEKEELQARFNKLAVLHNNNSNNNGGGIDTSVINNNKSVASANPPENDKREFDVQNQRLQSEVEALQQKLAKEKVLTQQAVNKLAEVMNRKTAAAAQPNKGGSGGAGGTRSVEYRKKEKECRQLEQDLTTLKARFHSLVRLKSMIQ